MRQEDTRQGLLKMGTRPRNSLGASPRRLRSSHQIPRHQQSKESPVVQPLVHQQEGGRKVSVKICQQDPEVLDISLQWDSPQAVQLLTVKLLVM
jgi:hypothetical protein